MALGFEQSKRVKMDELSSHIWSAPAETALPSQRVPTPDAQASQQEDHVQLMYCKDQVYQGDAEFSLEELRAQRYYRALSEKASNINRIKQELQLQIEQKQRLIQQRISTAPQQIVDEEAGSSAGACEPAAPVVKRAPFVIYSDREEGHEVQRRSSVSQEEHTHQSGSDSRQQKTATAKPFSASDENRQTHKPSSSANRVSLKLPTSSLKVPKSRAEPSADRDSSISRCEEAIVNGHWNKTLCRSPDDTCEFARATHLASTPFAGVERQKPPENPESTKAPSSAMSPEENKLRYSSCFFIIELDPDSNMVSAQIWDMWIQRAPDVGRIWADTLLLSAGPILEISQDLGGTSFANFSQDPMKRFNDTEISRAVEGAETVLENVSVTGSEDVCGPGVRSRLCQQADVTTFSSFHRKTELLPDTSGNLTLDGETLVYREKKKGFTVYSSSNATVLLKLDSSSVPWDFFISSQLRARLSHDQQDRLVQISCYVFENGCMTLWRIPHGVTIEDLLAKPIARPDVSRLVLLLLELVKRFHSCQVVHGGLKPETLYSYLSGVTALDFSSAVDLQLQSDVKTAQDLPSAQEYIQQGLLPASASPYQVDLIGLAEIVHNLLFNRPMRVTQENSAWSPEELSGSDQSAPVNSSWKDFFHMTLNPEQKSSPLLLADLISHVTDSL